MPDERRRDGGSDQRARGGAAGARPSGRELRRGRARAPSGGCSTSCTPIPTTIPFIVLLLGVVIFAFAHRRQQVLRAVQPVAGPAAGDDHRASLGIAQTLVILTAGIDLSVGAIMILSLGGHGPHSPWSTACRSPIAFPLGLLRRHRLRLGQRRCSSRCCGCRRSSSRSAPGASSARSTSAIRSSETIRQQDIEATAPFLHDWHGVKPTIRAFG